MYERGTKFVQRRPTGNNNKKLSCRREAARCFVFVCSQLQHTYSAVFLLLVTAASDLLVHKILLNSVLLSHIVSCGVCQYSNELQDCPSEFVKSR